MLDPKIQETAQKMLEEIKQLLKDNNEITGYSLYSSKYFTRTNVTIKLGYNTRLELALEEEICLDK